MRNPQHVNVLIPMAGSGQRFRDAGYTVPKPLIDVRGRPMIARVVENLQLTGTGYQPHFIFVVQLQHMRDGSADILTEIAPGCQIVTVDGPTEGAACTALQARHLINSDRPLLIANSDQLVRFDPLLFWLLTQGTDGTLLTFPSPGGSQWSFAAVEPPLNIRVTRVAEKEPISDVANTGIYFWARGRDYVAAAERMIRNGTRWLGEYYIAPVYNEALAAGLYINHLTVDEMWCLGTPADLERYLAAHPEPSCG